MLYPYQAHEVARLARDFPDQTFIVNHCGSPIDRDRDGMARWREGLKLIASAPNVLIKISGLTAYDPSPTPESLREVALHCIECFGTDRSMFGSDFPVGRLWTSFDAIFDGFKAMVSDFSQAEQAALFHDNARRVYRIDALSTARALTSPVALSFARGPSLGGRDENAPVDLDIRLGPSRHRLRCGARRDPRSRRREQRQSRHVLSRRPLCPAAQPEAKGLLSRGRHDLFSPGARALGGA